MTSYNKYGFKKNAFNKLYYIYNEFISTQDIQCMSSCLSSFKNEVDTNFFMKTLLRN